MIYSWGLNDADYPVRVCEYSGWSNGKQNVKVLWICPFFNRWKKMLERCHSAKFKQKNPAYEGCTVTEEWQSFKAFKAWMEQQNWEGKELDKDLLFPGNKVYSPETCLFVTQDVNKFFNEHAARVTGCSLAGVRMRPDNGKYVSTCRQLGGEQKYLGQFETEEAGHRAWLAEKKRLAIILADRQDDPKVKNAILNYFKE